MNDATRTIDLAMSREEAQSESFRRVYGTLHVPKELMGEDQQELSTTSLVPQLKDFTSKLENLTRSFDGLIGTMTGFKLLTGSIKPRREPRNLRYNKSEHVWVLEVKLAGQYVKVRAKRNRGLRYVRVQLQKL